MVGTFSLLATAEFKQISTNIETLNKQIATMKSMNKNNHLKNLFLEINISCFLKQTDYAENK